MLSEDSQVESTANEAHKTSPPLTLTSPRGRPSRELNVVSTRGCMTTLTPPPKGPRIAPFDLRRFYQQLPCLSTAGFIGPHGWNDLITSNTGDFLWMSSPGTTTSLHLFQAGKMYTMFDNALTTQRRKDDTRFLQKAGLPQTSQCTYRHRKQPPSAKFLWLP